MTIRIYPVEDVFRIACIRANITPSQVRNTAERKTPQWGPMARAAVCGAVFELCDISELELSQRLGHKSHTGVRAQIRRFHDEWPAMIRRAWIEAVICGLWGEQVKHRYPEIKNP